MQVYSVLVVNYLGKILLLERNGHYIVPCTRIQKLNPNLLLSSINSAMCNIDARLVEFVSYKEYDGNLYMVFKVKLTRKPEVFDDHKFIKAVDIATGIFEVDNLDKEFVRMGAN